MQAASKSWERPSADLQQGQDVSSMIARHWIPPTIQGSKGIGSPLEPSERNTAC